MKTTTQIALIAMLLFLLSPGSIAQQKLAQSGFQFLSVVSDARAAAIGEAATGLHLGSGSLFFNPAGMAEMTSFFDASVSSTKWIAEISHITGSAAFRPFDGKYGVVGLSIQYVNYGDFYGTVVNTDNPQGYDDLGIFRLSAYAVGLGYAKQLTDQFSIGGQIKLVHQDLGTSIIPLVVGNDTSRQNTSNKLNPLAFDFGTQFKTGIKSLVFGMSVRNFSKEVKYAQEGMQTPLAFSIGISMNVLDLLNSLPFDQALQVSIDASHYLDHPEQVKLGLEYRIMDIVALRGGFTSNTDLGSGLCFGLGASKFGFSIDWAYTPYGVFDNVQRITARFAL